MISAHDCDGSPRNQASQPGSAPRPRPVLYDRLDDALAVLDLEYEDRRELEERVSSMGSIDPLLGERIGVDRCTLSEAAAVPLTRTSLERLPTEGERAVAYVDSFYLPSGRFVQLRRRFPSEGELHAALEGKNTLQEPALWIREILLPHTEEMPSAALIDAATVVIAD